MLYKFRDPVHRLHKLLESEVPIIDFVDLNLASFKRTNENKL